MASIEKFMTTLIESGIEFFTGVPDSYLNGFCDYLIQNIDVENNIITANEGNAIGVAAGHFLATQKSALVYMQNSGLGNAINPLASLADEKVYQIPMILLIGWRGEPGTGDWPQHEMQGAITTKLLDDLEIPYGILSDKDEENIPLVKKAVAMTQKRKRFALIAPNKVLTAKKENRIDSSYPLSRSQVMDIILDHLPENTIYSASTGRLTRELYHLRTAREENHQSDYLNVGSMGHASSVALGIALENKERLVACLDGDCATLMHMGALAMVSKYKAPNFIHIMFNNGAHESVGGQPSVGFKLDFTKIAEGAGYETIGKFVSTESEIIAALQKLLATNNASFLEIRIHQGIDKSIPELKIDHRELIDQLISELNNKEKYNE